MSDLDLSQPIAAILRESTRKVHENVEQSTAAVAILRGELNIHDYTRFLMMLWHIYNAFERALDRHSSNPVLEPTYNPTLLARTPTLAADIAYLLEVPESSWKSHPMHKTLMASPPPALSAYVSRIEELSNTNPESLLAHSYVRYLGDLSGGQTIKHTLAKTYSLDETTGEGLSFYTFKELRSGKQASQGELKRIKEWFRDGMNSGVGDDVKVKAAVAKEAVNVFLLNRDLFDAIITIRTDVGESKDIPIIIEQTGQATETTYTYAQVASVLAAVCLAHFLLVTGGFTGEKGYAKLQAIEAWISSYWADSSV